LTRVLSAVTSSTARSGGGTFATTPSLFTSAASSRMMKGVKLSSSPRSVVSLSALSLLRGGDDDVQIDVESSSSSLDETESFDADINMQRVYGTNNNDEESPEAAAVEMTTKKSSTLKSKKSDLTYDASSSSSTSTTSLISSSRMALSSVVSPLSSILAAFATFYTRQLSVRPILTKSLTAGIIFMASDYCAQLIERSNNGTDEEDDNNNKMPLVWSRMVTNFLVGLLVFGPAANAWYSTIFKLLPSTSLISTLQKAALGQLIFGPAFTSVFFGAGMIQSASFSVGGWLQKVQQDLPAVWASGLGFWPFVDFISYKIIPVQWIPLFVNFCSFVWTIYLSIVSNRGSSGEDTA
jgi:protein Mpv17